MTVMSIDSLPTGFRFHPKEEELVHHYLRLKINGNNSVDAVIREVDICKHEPEDLPDLSVIQSDDKEWFYFAPPVRKYPNSRRKKRATEAGFWKTTGRDQTIKASKSGMKPIGKRKTLVFYRGRAPHAERTCWKIYEYRATEEELDGTKPGQSPFVVCRLFWEPDKKKPHKKAKNSSSDEAEPSGSSSSATKSLSKDTPVEVQETPEVIDNLDNIPPGPLVQGYITSDAEDCELEVHARESYLQLYEEYRRLIDEPLSCKPISPLQTEMRTGERPPFMDSRFTKDFGYDISEIEFHNGSNDPDPSITEFLDSFLNYDQDEYSEESTNQKTSVVESEEVHPEISVDQSFLQEPVFQKDNGSRTDSDTEVEEKQYALFMGASWQINEYTDMENSMDLNMRRSHGTFSGGEYGIGNVDFPSTYPLEESISDGLSGTGIEIRPRQPQDEPNCRIRAQGSAPRRIWLQREAICDWEDDESKPTVIEAGEATEYTSKEASLVESGNKLKFSLETFTKPKLRSLRRHGVIESKQKGHSHGPSCVLAEASPARPGSRFLSGYIVSVALVIILFLLFIGLWRCFTHEIVSFSKIY